MLICSIPELDDDKKTSKSIDINDLDEIELY